jgi:uncharacterized protein
MRVFVDSSAWVALNDLTDQHHAVAVEKLARIRSEKVELVTSDYILDETLTLIRMRTFHQAAIVFGELLMSSGVAGMVTISDEVRSAAFVLFKKYDDKDLSFTDCTSFALMKRLKVQTAFTFDGHFQQVGFMIW